MAVGHHGGGLPVAFMITKTETAENISAGLKQFRDFLDEETTAGDPPVRPSATLTDDSTAEQNALGCDACSVRIQIFFARCSSEREIDGRDMHVLICIVTNAVIFYSAAGKC
jgi:hypothetical protein